MPEKILELLENGSLTEEQLAGKLKLSVSEVRACIDYLQQCGYIRQTVITPTGGGCSGNCQSCNSSCQTQTGSAYSYTVWEIN